MTEVILVDEFDNPRGTMEKLLAHQKAELHRAFSIFIYNKKGEMLLQKRANNKYHNGGLWTNTCCSHPLPGEETQVAASRRLKEEMGFSTPLQYAFGFVYKAAFDNGLTEFEYDHVFIGNYDGPLFPNYLEISEYAFMNIEEIRRKISQQPANYTEWFKLAFERVAELNIDATASLS